MFLWYQASVQSCKQNGSMVSYFFKKSPDLTVRFIENKLLLDGTHSIVA